MAGGGVLLRPEHRGDLKHPLKHPHHGLLVELGGLGQKRLLAEVLHPEDVAAPLGPGVDDFGGMDLGEAPGHHLLSEGPAHGLLHFEHGALAQIAQHHRPQGELSIQIQVEFVLVNGHAYRLGRNGEHLNVLHPELHPHGGPLIGGERSGDHRRTLLDHPLQLGLVLHHALQRPIPEPQGQEGDGTHAPKGVDCTVYGHSLIQVGTSPEMGGAQMGLLPHSGHEFHLCHILFRKIWF